MVGLSVASVALAPPASLPDLFPVLVSVASFLHLLGFLIYFHIVQFSELSRKSNKKNKWAVFWLILCQKNLVTRQSRSCKSTKTANWMEISGYAEVSLLMFRIKTDGINCKCKIISLKQKIVMDQGCPVLNFHIFLIFFSSLGPIIMSVQMRRLAQAAKCDTSRERWF